MSRRFGALAELRRERGLTQAELAVRIGCSQSQVCRWEGGVRSLALSDAVAVAAALDLDVGQLMALCNSPRRQRSPEARKLARRVGFFLYVRRCELELTPTDVLERTGISPRRLDQIESGAPTTEAELAVISAMLGVSWSVALSDVEAPQRVGSRAALDTGIPPPRFTQHTRWGWLEEASGVRKEKTLVP